jgi:hypothetical protein
MRAGGQQSNIALMRSCDGAGRDEARGSDRDWAHPSRQTSSQFTSFAGVRVTAQVNGRGRAYPRLGRAQAHSDVARSDAGPSRRDLFETPVIAKSARGRSISARRDPRSDRAAYPVFHHQSPPVVANCDRRNMRAAAQQITLHNGAIAQ